MKRLFYMIFACCISLFSCTSESEMDELTNNDSDIIIVGINLTGEIETEETLLTRAETDGRDLIGIQVYKNGSVFCYGLFDDLKDVKVALKAGATYSFICSVIKNGKDICYHPDGCNYNGYPFYLGSTGRGNNCDNTFYYYSSFGIAMLPNTQRFTRIGYN